MGSDDKPWNRGVPLKTREAAREVFLEGNRLFRVPLFARAAEQYAAALSTWKHPAFYFNLAIAQLNLGEDVEAHDSLLHALQQGPEPLGDEQFREAKKQLAEVERQLGRIRISCKTKGAEITLDGAPISLASGGYQSWTQAKSHELTAKRPGYLPDTRRVVVAAGELKSVDLELVTLSDATDTSRRWSAWKPWTVVAGGVAIAAAGGVLHALSSRNFNGYDQGFLLLPCVTAPDAAHPGCAKGQVPPQLSAQLDRATLQQQIAVGGYIAGGALIATGAILLYLNRPQLVEQRGAGTSAGRVTVAPSISPEGLGIFVSVSQ